ncbi:MAG: PepSY domain-containing protein [Saprospiraceae bacterium]|nr:PepSY domain-containing protein [Saprospiraceae bacterium]
MYIEPQNQRLPIDVLMANFNQKYNAKINRLTIPDAANKSVLIGATNPKTKEPLYVYVNPYNGKLLGERNMAVAQFFTKNVQLHRWLLIRNPGRTIVGIATLIFVIMTITGFILWLPPKLKALKTGLTISWRTPWKALNYQLHNVLGFYALLLLFVMAFSGLYISQEWLRNGVNKLIGEEQGTKTPKEQAKSTSLIEDSLQDTLHFYQNILNSSYEALPYNSEVSFSFPREEEGNISIGKYNYDNALGARLSETAQFDSKTGALVEVEQFKDRSAVSKFRYINRFLHTGEILGLPLMILYFLACLVGTSLPITGTIIWINKINQRRRILT